MIYFNFVLGHKFCLFFLKTFNHFAAHIEFYFSDFKYDFLFAYLNVGFIFKDIEATKFAQAFDVFEPFKFVGRIVNAEGTLTAPIGEALLALYERGKNEPLQVVGLIVNEEAAVIEGHEVYSTGGLWCTVQDLCTHHGASSMIVVGL